MTLLQTIIAHLRHEREPIDRWQLAVELARLDRLTKLHEKNKEQPVSQHDFDDAIGLAITYGELKESGGKVWLAVKEAEKSTQGELF